MKRTAIILIVTVLMSVSARAGVTLEECIDKAEQNYPLIRRYGIVEKTSALSLSDINKSWLPRIGVSGQLTFQNTVPEFPSSLQSVLDRFGQNYKGLDRLQYKAGVDVSQTVWDGGASKARRAVERASVSEQRAAIDVRMYAIREKLTDIYFGILLMNRQIAQAENTLVLLRANHSLMRSMLESGVAMQSDVDKVEAQILSLAQQLTGARSAEKGYRRMLSVYVGEDIGNAELQTPEATMPPDLAPARPELKLFDAQMRLNSARSASVNSTVMPRIGLFAQAYYGYPGINYFESMARRDPSFNLLAGVKVSWSIDSFYTKGSTREKLALSAQGIENDRDIFLYNTRIRTCAQTEDIAGMRKVLTDDARIVELRKNIRLAAESQLRNGIIDATELLSAITDENQAALMAAYHEIQLLRKIYELKNTINR